MDKGEIEPGLIQTFRWFAMLKLALLIILLGIQMSNAPLQVFWPLALLMIAENSWLLGYLFINPLRHRLGHYYLPIALIIGAGGILLERELFSPLQRLWQPDAFFFLLLVLIAWQYRFWVVGVYTLLLGVTDFGLYQYAIPQELFPQPIDDGILIGRLLMRSVVFLLMGFVVTNLMNKQRQHRLALEKANLKLLQHTITNEQLAINRERNRLSRELHDTLAHTLSGVVVQLEAVIAVWENIPERARLIVEQVIENARSGLAETRRALGNLRATPLEEMGLALATRTLAEDVSARYGLKLALEIPDTPLDIPLDVEQAFFRIAQEAFNNITRHAKAENISVELSIQNDDLTLMISDNGQGFKPDHAVTQEQYGLQGMRERAEMIHAQFAITSAPDLGTTIQISKEI